MIQASFYEFLNSKNDLELLGVKGDKEAFEASEVALFCGKKSFVLPDLRASFGDDLLSFSEEMMQLLETLHNFYNEKSTKKILIAPVRTLLTPLPKSELFDTFELAFAKRLNFN